MKREKDIIDFERINGIVGVKILGASDPLFLGVNHRVRIDQAQSHLLLYSLGVKTSQISSASQNGFEGLSTAVTAEVAWRSSEREARIVICWNFGFNWWVMEKAKNQCPEQGFSSSDAALLSRCFFLSCPWRRPLNWIYRHSKIIYLVETWFGEVNWIGWFKFDQILLWVGERRNLNSYRPDWRRFCAKK